MAALVAFFIVFIIFIFFASLWGAGAYTIFDFVRNLFRKKITEIEVSCPKCHTSNYWPPCQNCNSSDFKTFYQGNTLVSVGCKRCGQYYYPPLKCRKCNANLHGKLFN